jgi:hypothetical protein
MQEAANLGGEWARDGLGEEDRPFEFLGQPTRLAWFTTLPMTVKSSRFDVAGDQRVHCGLNLL